MGEMRDKMRGVLISRSPRTGGVKWGERSNVGNL